MPNSISREPLLDANQRDKEVAREWKLHGSFLALRDKAWTFCQMLFRISYLFQQLRQSHGRVGLGKPSYSSTALSRQETSLWRHPLYKKGGRGGWLGKDNSKGCKDEAHQRKAGWQLCASEDLTTPCITIFSWLQQDSFLELLLWPPTFREPIAVGSVSAAGYVTLIPLPRDSLPVSIMMEHR